MQAALAEASLLQENSNCTLLIPNQTFLLLAIVLDCQQIRSCAIRISSVISDAESLLSGNQFSVFPGEVSCEEILFDVERSVVCLVFGPERYQGSFHCLYTL